MVTHRSTARSALRTGLRAAAAVGAAGVAGLGYAYAESGAYTVRRFMLPVLPPGSPTLRVLHVTDLHLTPRDRREVAFVRSLGALEPDLVVDTGDNLAHVAAVPTVLHALEPLLEVPGVFVLGSNDYYAPKPKNPARYLRRGDTQRVIGDPLPTDRLVDGLTAAGWRDLTNRRDTLTVRGLRLGFAGVDDPHIHRDRYPAPSPAPDGTAADLTIGVSHAPYTRVLDAMTAEGIPLVLAGHTHGGQLCVPLYGSLVTNSDLDRHRCKGVSRWWPGAADVDPRTPPPDDAAWLHVSAGLGTSPFTPVRVACRPEASLLTLTAAG